MSVVKVFITCSHLNALASLSTVYLIERQQIRNISPLWHFGLQTNSSVSVCSLCEGSKDIKNLNTFLHLFRFFQFLLLHYWFGKMIQHWSPHITRPRVTCTIHTIPLVDGWPHLMSSSVMDTGSSSCCNFPKRINALHGRCIPLATSLVTSAGWVSGLWRGHSQEATCMRVFYTLPISGFDPASLMEGTKRRCKGAINDACYLCTISCSIPCLLMECKSAMQSDPIVTEKLFVLCALLVIKRNENWFKQFADEWRASRKMGWLNQLKQNLFELKL